jgi:uncharacterized protein (UPF0210 family)
VSPNRRQFLSSMGAAALLPIAPQLLRAFADDASPAQATNFKVRTITAGVPTDGTSLEPIHRAIAMLRRARPRVESAGFQVEGVRITTTPFAADVAPGDRARVLAHLQAIDEILGAEKVSMGLGPVMRADRYDASLGDWLVEFARTTRHINFNLMIATAERPVHREGARTATSAILALANANPDGSANFRFAAVANMPPGSPFFPGGYHDGPPSFSIGLESASLVHDAFDGAPDPGAGESRLRDSMNKEYAPLERVALEVAKDVGFEYLGIDSSPAPSTKASICTALEALTHVPFGGASTLQACAAVTAAIKSLSVRTCGYSGLMLPVLEDTELATRATEGRYGVRELLLYSSVCGTGLDTVPIAGDTPPERITRILEDVATMSSRLRKPLSARLFPAVGKRAGESVNFKDLAPSIALEVT